MSKFDRAIENLLFLALFPVLLPGSLLYRLELARRRVVRNLRRIS